MQHTKKKCCKLALGEVECFPQVNTARQCKILWQLIVKRKRSRLSSLSHIKRKAQSSGIIAPLSCTLEQAYQHLNAAIQECEKLKPKATNYSEKGSEASRKMPSGCFMRT